MLHQQQAGQPEKTMLEDGQKNTKIQEMRWEF